MRRLLPALLCCALFAAACDRLEGQGETDRPEPVTARFHHSQSVDLSGYYPPTSEVRFGDAALHHLFIAGTADFAQWEGPGRRYSPIHLVFDDVTSPIQAPETGEGHAVQMRVQPTAYDVGDGRIRFEGSDPRLGPVRFDGRLDPDALAQARRSIGSPAPVLRGTLTVGGRSRTVAMRWFGGD